MVVIKGVRRVDRVMHEDEDEPRAGWWADGAGDGWNTEDEAIANVVAWCSEVVDLKYELDNARRGAYAVSGDDPSALLEKLTDLQATLEEVVDGLEARIESEV
jgi:hypothetical protein